MDSKNVEGVDDVLSWNEGKLCTNLSEALAFLKTQCTKCEDEANTYRIIDFAFRSCIRFVPLPNLERELFSFICPTLNILFSDILRGLDAMQEGNGFTQTQCDTTESIAQLLSLCSEIVMLLKDVVDYLLEKKEVKAVFVISLYNSCGLVINDSLSHCKKNIKFYGNKRMLNDINEFSFKASELFLQFIKLVKDLDFETSPDDVDHLVAVVKYVSKTAILTLDGENYKVMAESWKCLMMLLEKYNLSHLNLSVNESIEAIVKKVQNNLDHFLRLEIQVQAESLDYLKICTFFLKIIIKLCDLFGNFIDSCIPSLVNLLFTLFRYPPSQLISLGMKPSIVAETAKTTVVPANVILAKMSSNIKFAQQILMNDSTNKRYEFIILSCCLLKKLNDDSIDIYVNSKYNILGLILDAFVNSTDNILNGKFKPPGSVTSGHQIFFDFYDFCLASITAFILTTLNSQQFLRTERLLMKNILQENPWRALLASDIWCLIARNKEPEFCHSLVDSIIPIFEHIDSNLRPEFVYLSSLVKRLLPLCQSEYINKLLNSYQPLKYPKIWRNLQLTMNIVPNNSALFNYDELKIKLKQTTNPTELLSMVHIIHTIANISISSPKGSVLLGDLWNFDNDKIFCTSYIGEIYINSAATLTANYIAISSPDILLSVLQHLRRLYFSVAISSKLHFLSILAAFGSISLGNCTEKAEILSSIADLFHTFFMESPCPIVREATFHVFANFARKTSHMEIITNVANSTNLGNDIAAVLQKKFTSKNINLDFISSVNFKHECRKCLEATNHVINPKRIKVDFGELSETNNIIDSYLNELQVTTDLLHSQNLTFNKQQKTRIVALCQKLQMLT